MLKEMSKKYWRNMTETSLVQPLIAGAARELEMIDRRREGRFGPRVRGGAALQSGGNLRTSWEALLADARKCTRCDLYKHATQTVFGEGPLDAAIMFVGEQPGDQEDIAGRPFVGPAGQLFDAALEKAGIDRVDRLRHQRRQALQVRASAASAASTTSPTPARSRRAAGGSSTSAN